MGNKNRKTCISSRQVEGQINMNIQYESQIKEFAAENRILDGTRAKALKSKAGASGQHRIRLVRPLQDRAEYVG